MDISFIEHDPLLIRSEQTQIMQQSSISTTDQLALLDLDKQPLHVTEEFLINECAMDESFFQSNIQVDANANISKNNFDGETSNYSSNLEQIIIKEKNHDCVQTSDDSSSLKQVNIFEI